MRIPSGILTMIALLTITACIEVYQPPEISNPDNLLVVDGFLNGTDSICSVRLSRTYNISSDEGPPAESGAVVSLEEEGGQTFTLTETESGVYHVINVPVSSLKKYKLKVETINGDIYTSDFVELKQSPPIDSVTWELEDDGIQISVNTHDTENQSKYYKWDYIETWQYGSRYTSIFRFENGNAVLRNENIHYCWKTVPSGKIAVSSTINLNEDVIRKFPIIYIPKKTEKTLMRYSVLIKQSVLTKDAYDFWSRLEKNTENLGSLFDPLPSEVLGNLKNEQDPNEPVLGYFSASYIQESRIFISLHELPLDFWYLKDSDCIEDTVLLQDLSSFVEGAYLLTNAIYDETGARLLGYGYSSVRCVDCRVGGGINVKPSFWK